MSSARVSLALLLIFACSLSALALPHPDVVPGKTYVDLEFKVKVADSPGEKAGSWGLTFDVTMPFSDIFGGGGFARSIGVGA